ncbi:MAG: ferrous iron transport protein B [Bacteroidetes bacterium GWF2_38_335]|nr:MAG: ferrous iron transport protein B [Bacteroidetes bacterium GWF2_38_335]OFY81814.1 MAG: ferrous iron transport protein B [Bacteroidetes bacterium RIFOXYA12_FULL_38_20]HBS87887.1 ferrous iron transport protein B [Bacteroidales bacterium]
MVLSELVSGEKGIITKVTGRGAFRKRIMEMGFVKGKEVTVVKNAPLKDPIEYKIMGYEVSLRRSEAQLIEIITREEAINLQNEKYEGTFTDDQLKITAREKGKIINIALVGNPNCGKTTLFNYASGSQEHVGNYSGVTVDSKSAIFKQSGYQFNLVDLPGTYSLSAYSPEELFVRKYIINNVPDIVVNVVDAGNLERNLYLTTQLIDMDIKVVIALNMFDELEKKGDRFDYEAFGKMTGIPIIPTISSKGKGIHDLFSRIIEVYEDRDTTIRHIHINYGKEVENTIKILQDEIKVHQSVDLKVAPRYLAIRMIERDKTLDVFFPEVNSFFNLKRFAERQLKSLEDELNEEGETIITDAKYGFIAGALKETYSEGKEERKRKTQMIDTFVTHKVFGFPIFIVFMWFMFFATFTIGSYPMEWLEKLVELISAGAESVIPGGTFKDLFVDGIISGVGGVIVFLPNILILFFFISLMEDTGYMSRAAFIMDKLMHKMGLHGKSFIPMIMGFGCTVPAIMATRTIENRGDRLLTMLVTPFMSCSARLPVYVLLISAFFPGNPSLVLFGIYLTGILIAIIMAILLKRIFFRSKEAPFVMELPPYRIPTLRTTSRHMWHKGMQYLKKMGGIILVASIIIWALGYFPREVEYSKNYDKLISQTNDKQLIHELHLEQQSEKMENSYIGKIGKFIEPVITPLGFDWKMGVSLLTGIAAKEIVVSTLGVLYHAESDADKTSLVEHLKNETYRDGKRKGEKVFNSLSALSFLLFILIYFPCIAVVAAIRKESGKWKWAFFTIFYTTALAWVVSFLVYQGGMLL